MRLFAVALSVLFVASGQGKEPGDMENSYQNLQKAVKDNDAAQVKKLAAETSAAARAIISSSAPQGDAEKETWTKDVAYAKEVDAYTEYALYTVGVQAKPAEAVELFALLEQQSPKSKYLDDGYGFYLGCLRQTGGGAKEVGIAAKGLANFPGNEDLLMLLAESSMKGKRYDATIGYADRLVAAASKRNKTANVGQGYYLSGVARFFKNQYPQTDKSLRAALPLIQGDQKACALFYLGVANYQLGKATMNKGLIKQGATFSEQSAAVKSPCQQQAYGNSLAMKAEAK
jgi:tetratricopeptide (TPR) repeat protein